LVVCLQVFGIDAWHGKLEKQNMSLLSAASCISVQQITFEAVYALLDFHFMWNLL
jgi:hypothetical protein